MNTSLINQTLLSALESACNAWLRLDPETLPRFSALAGKVIAVELRGLSWTWFILPDATGIRLLHHFEGSADATLRGTPLALLNLGLQRKTDGKPPPGLFAGDVEISGDVELGQRFKQILDAIDIDWEELLSQKVGDLLAHKLGNTVRDAQAWGARTLDTFGQNITEYQQEEARNLPAPGEINAFLADVDTLRDDLARMEQRVRRLLTHSAKTAEEA